MDPLAGEEERGKGVEAPQEGPGPQGQQVAGLVRLGGAWVPTPVSEAPEERWVGLGARGVVAD